MPENQSREARLKDRQKARDEAREKQADRDLELALNTQPSQVTARDALGVERIVTTTYGYEPPQVEPDPKEVERLKNVNKRLANKRDERLRSLTDTPDGSAKVAAKAIKSEDAVGAPADKTKGSDESSASADKPKGGNA